MSQYASFRDLEFLSPLIALLVGALTLLNVDCFLSKRFKSLNLLVTCSTFIVASILLTFRLESQNPLLLNWIQNDRLGHILSHFFLIVGLITALLGASFFKKFHPEESRDGEFYFLLIAAIFGLILIGLSSDFLTLFLGIETLSISLYVLCGYQKNWSISKEAAIKYFLTGSLASAFLLYGIALLYGATGTTNFSSLFKAYQLLTGFEEKVLFLGGIAFLTVGLLFKVTIVPFHLWAPDVYEGATTPVTAFMAVGTKIGIFAALIRVFIEALPNFNPVFNQALLLLFFPTLIYGSFLALRQVNLRRFFAFSGMSHSAYLLIPIFSNQTESVPSMIYYLVVYALATFGAFTFMVRVDKEKKGLRIEDLEGLFFKAPFLTGLFTCSLLILAGIPPFAGFFAKFYIFKIGIQGGYYIAVAFGLVMTVISFYYYLKILCKMFKKTDIKQEVLISKDYFNNILTIVFLIIIVFFLVTPDIIINLY